MECAREIDKEPVIVGGTGLYIKALVDPLFAAPELDAVQRAKLERELETKSLDDLRHWCRELDPKRAHLGRTQLIRAIETALLSGERISDLHARHHTTKAPKPKSTDAVYLVLDPGPALASRIESRVEKMLDSGWPEEVRGLLTNIPPDAPAWKASGYSVIREYVEGELDLSSARQRIIIETRQYAKRQRTWFRHQLPLGAVTIVNPDDSGARAAVREWWERAE
jgi:tRNA dimethylallyltransferase